MIRDMTYEDLHKAAVIMSTLGVSFAALCVWLGVRIISRRERWAKWTLAIALALVLIYPLSFTPFYWLASKFDTPMWVYSGLDLLYVPLPYAVDVAPRPLQRWCVRYGMPIHIKIEI